MNFSRQDQVGEGTDVLEALAHELREPAQRFAEPEEAVRCLLLAAQNRSGGGGRRPLHVSVQVGTYSPLAQVRACVFSEPSCRKSCSMGVMPILNTDRAYLAATRRPGEGMIAIEKYQIAGHYKSPRYTMKVDIQMSDDALAIDHVATLFEPQHHDQDEATANMTKVAYRISWQAPDRGAASGVPLPYLVPASIRCALVALDFQVIAGARQARIRRCADPLRNWKHGTTAIASFGDSSVNHDLR